MSARGAGPVASLLLAAAAALAGLVMAAGCAKEQGPPPLFEGARPVELESVRAGKEPTPAELEKLVGTMLEVAGGARRLQSLSWKRVEDLYLSHTATLLDNRVTCTTLVRSDRSTRVQLDYAEGFVEVRVLLKGEEYLLPRQNSARKDGERPALQLAAGASQQHVLWDWELSRLPYLLAEAASLTPLPPRVAEGRTLVGMRVEVADVNPKFEAWIDPAGPVIVEVRALLPVTADLTPRSEALQVQRFSDFRRVAGILFPFRRDLYVDDRRFGLAEARSIEVEVSLHDEDFLSP